MARPLVAAGVLYRDDAGRVLLVRPTYKDGWDIPGGYVEPGESPHAAARREVIEELGAPFPVGRLLIVDWAPHPTEGDKLLFVFDGGQLTAEQHASVQFGADELEQSLFHEPGVLAQLMPDRLARRVLLALTAIPDEPTVYAEHGSTATSNPI